MREDAQPYGDWEAAVSELPGPLVTTDWLAAHLGAPGLLVLDASVGAHRGAGRRIAGARPFDIDGALSDPRRPAAAHHAGRRPVHRRAARAGPR